LGASAAHRALRNSLMGALRVAWERLPAAPGQSGGSHRSGGAYWVLKRNGRGTAPRRCTSGVR